MFWAKALPLAKSLLQGRPFEIAFPSGFRGESGFISGAFGTPKLQAFERFYGPGLRGVSRPEILKRFESSQSKFKSSKFEAILTKPLSYRRPFIGSVKREDEAALTGRRRQQEETVYSKHSGQHRN